ncbi:MAG: glutamyl-tRNA reductase [Prolixibacteraceae bacterium]|nr:glutamyl-tRNA reductase [Prolixibacteraceae bacterium]
MIGIIGLNHKSAPLSIREKFSFNKDDIKKLTQSIAENNYISEIVILSTCNRTEIYFRSGDCCSAGAFSIIYKSLFKYVNIEKAEKYFYRFESLKAIDHLFRVVSSLDSMILGEYQIVNQIKEAYRMAIENHSVKKTFRRLFTKALETGKEVRTKTNMSQGAFSVSYAAVEKCYEKFPTLAEKNILLIGAGKTGELVIKNLSKKGCNNITITNRTESRAVEIANKYKAQVLPFSNWQQGLKSAEIIISSITCKEPLINKEKTESLSSGTDCLMVDLGVPRNIHPDVQKVKGITLLNIDDLKETLAIDLKKKKKCISTAETIVANKTKEFSEWLNTQNLAPTISKIVSAVNNITEKEMDSFRKNLTEEESPQIKEYSKYLSEKMMKYLIRNLKTISNNGQTTEYIKIIQDLFSGK